jgi:two-component sensor histidine kinase
VAKQELAPYLQDGAARARIEGPCVLLEPTMAQAIAVSLHELATNAAKYGALSETKGRVEFTWSHRPDDQLVLRWTERDGPKITAPKRKGFGARVISTMIEDQLKGQLRLDWSAQGLTCEIVFPMRDHTVHPRQVVDDPAVNNQVVDNRDPGLGILRPAPAGPDLPLLETH